MILSNESLTTTNAAPIKSAITGRFTLRATKPFTHASPRDVIERTEFYLRALDAGVWSEPWVSPGWERWRQPVPLHDSHEEPVDFADPSEPMDARIQALQLRARILFWQGF